MESYLAPIEEGGALASCLKESGWEIWDEFGVFNASLTKDGYGISGHFSESFTDTEGSYPPSLDVTMASEEWDPNLDYLLYGSYTGVDTSSYDSADTMVEWANEEPPDAPKAEKVLWDVLNQIEKCMGERTTSEE